MTPSQAAKALAKARALTRQAYANWRTADMKPGTATARDACRRGDQQHAEAEALFDELQKHLEEQ